MFPIITLHASHVRAPQFEPLDGSPQTLHAGSVLHIWLLSFLMTLQMIVAICNAFLYK